MRIAHLARVSYPYHPYGGLEQHVYRLTVELARLGHDVQLYTQPPTITWKDGLREPIWAEGIVHHFIPYQVLPLRRNSVPDRLINYPLFSKRMGRSVKKLNPFPQVIHAHGLVAWGCLSQKFSHIPLIMNPHGMEEFKVRSIAKKLAYLPFRQMLRNSAGRSDMLVATDRTLISEVSKNLKVSLDKIKLIPNAVSLEEILQIAKPADIQSALELYKPDSTKLLMLSVGRLESNKGFDKMLEALARIRSNLPEGWKWALVGTGYERASLENLTHNLNLTDNVCFTGSLSDQALHALYEVADVFIHPTLYEGSSLVTLEAMSHSLPIIASKTGGLPDKVFTKEPNRNGWLVEPGDVNGLANTIKEFVDLSTESRLELGKNSKQIVQDHFTWRKAAQQTVDLYEELLASKR